MKIGISRPSRTLPESQEVLELAHQFGFQGVQLKPAQYEAFITEPEQFQAFYGSLAGLVRGGLIVYPHGAPETWPEQLGPKLKFAAAVGAPHICLCSGVYASGASEAEVNAVAQALLKIGASAQSRGIVTSIHNHADSLVETEEDIARLLDKIDPHLCGLTLDTAHAARGGVASVAKLVFRFRDYLLNVHLKDMGPDGRFCALGQGTLNLTSVLAALSEIHYDEWLIVDEETADLSTGEAFRIARDYLRGVQVFVG